MDYIRMQNAMEGCRMTEADQVISGPARPSFSIKGIKAIGCSGTHNITTGSFPALSKTQNLVTNADFLSGNLFSGIKLSFETKIIEQLLPLMKN